jgi:hypothetical protein
MESTQYVDLLSLNVPENAGAITLASKNYFTPERPLVWPGRYFSPTRTIKGGFHKPYGEEVLDENNFDFAIDFGRDGFVTSPSDPRPVFGAPRDYPNTIPKKNYRGVGEGSRVVQYLLACGFPEAQVFTLAPKELLALMLESQNRPVGVKIGWRNDAKYDAEKGMKAVYTSAFRNGEKDGKAIYEPRVELADGRQVTAKAVVEEYFDASNWK